MDGSCHEPARQPVGSLGLEACIAFATASRAVIDVLERYEAAGPVPAAEIALLDELRISHDQLLELFASEADQEVCGLALSILVLADRLASSLE